LVALLVVLIAGGVPALVAALTGSQPTSSSTSATDKAPQIQLPGGAEPGVAGFNGATCAGSSVCLAVGASASDGATIAKSTDGGSSWAPVTVPDGTPTLSDVACTDKEHCAAVGAGAILTSADGGSSWSSANDPLSGANLLGVTCATTDTCLAAGVTADDNGLSGAILRSTDGGGTWATAQIPDFAGGALGAVVCPSATTCIAVGNDILVSTDAGQTWSFRAVAGGMQSLRSIACSTAEHCVAIGPNPLASKEPGLAAFAVETLDGGATWSALVMPQGSGDLDAVSCPSTSSCEAVGGDSANGLAPTGLISDDGGHSWALAQGPSAFTGIATLVCPPGGSSCMAAGRGSGGLAAGSGPPGTPGAWSPKSIAKSQSAQNGSAT
jgi:photosystem II stability/assembly factor-like uncharacterized protein